MLVNPEKESVRCDNCRGQANYITAADLAHEKQKSNSNLDKLLANKAKNGGRLAITDKRKSNAKIAST